MYNNIEKSYANEARKAPKREAVKDYKLQENFKFELSQAFLCHFDTTVTMLTMFILSNVYKFESKQHSVIF